MKQYWRYLGFAVLAVAMIVLYPREGKFQYNYQIGHPWLYETLIAPIDFPLLKTESEMLAEMEEKASDVVDCYNFDISVGPSMIERFSRVSIEHNLDVQVRKVCTDILYNSYENGIVSDFGGGDISDKVIFVQKDRRVSEIPAVNVNTVEYVYNSIVYELGYKFPSLDVEALVSSVNLRSFVAPNLLYDENTTQMVHREAVNYISPSKGMIYAGQLIVSKGELVTSEICQMLDSYKAEYKVSFGYTESGFSLFLEHLLVTVLIVALFAVTLLFEDRSIYSRLNELMFYLLMMLLSFAATSLLCRLNQKLLFLFPYAVFITIASSFFKKETIFPIYAVILLPVLILAESGLELFLINIVSGAVALLALSRFSRGWVQFLNVCFIFLSMMVVRIALNLAAGVSNIADVLDREVVFLALNSFLVIMLYPLVFLFEKGFAFVSYARLRDLADTNNDLLQELQRKAPGTFQHSLQVANMAEYAARSIGASPMLVRVGALYHDIGKGENPMCFVENQTEGVEYHKQLTPEESARLIIKHVEDGMSLARKGGLPEVVSDFILTHHGTTSVSYFYNVFCNNGGDSQLKNLFTYPGKRPETKEQVILMMADSVEAASRTLKNYSDESISNLVDKILEGKITSEQFAGADISLKDVEIVKDSFKNFIKQFYHSRISYPKLRRPSKEQK